MGAAGVARKAHAWLWPDLADGFTLVDHVLSCLPYRREVPVRDLVRRVAAQAGSGEPAAYREVRRLWEAGALERRGDRAGLYVRWVPDALTKDLPDD